ncbi:Holliday junction ATP-dependent DNA helicase RuvA [Caloramator mitchellensis]|uniref:Holliday junction branch migration complex subunit RuvA n=1 Tax=Caloramator mitchellensis TaxID=908809 RepID=A0A0R3JVE1_CALMK|nr:Holliday junction branch migration protein RuvA [Caloramator mitchellensis]KRQ87512.1 Holliday junction ATP-dependent DNA helicase RuvA [Caloramator mitchellensis]
MFAYIKGELSYLMDDYVVVDNNGIGYLIFMPSTDIDKLKGKKDVIVYTHYHVREDLIALYGFCDKESLNIFKMLINISGVGPKAALSILSVVSPQNFILAVITNDDKTLSKAQGIGKKLAQRIILELKDKFKDYDLSSEAKELDDVIIEKDGTKEAVAALVSLGYTKQEAIHAIKGLDTSMKVEDIIKIALKHLMKG